MLTYLLCCTVSKLWVIIGQTFASESGLSHFISLSLGLTPANIAINDKSLKTRFCGIQFRCSKYWRIFNHFYVIRPESYHCTKFGEITRRFGLLRRSRSFKVTDFGTNRKLIYDFLLVINTNLPPILHRYQVMADYWSNFR